MSSTSEELASQAEQLQAAISFFRLDEQAVHAREPAPAGKKVVTPMAPLAPAKVPAAGAPPARPAPGKKAVGGGFALDMGGDIRGQLDRLDSEFERDSAA